MWVWVDVGTQVQVQVQVQVRLHLNILQLAVFVHVAEIDKPHAAVFIVFILLSSVFYHGGPRSRLKMHPHGKITETEACSIAAYSGSMLVLYCMVFSSLFAI
jgi:hypothetical protein